MCQAIRSPAIYGHQVPALGRQAKVGRSLASGFSWVVAWLISERATAGVAAKTVGSVLSGTCRRRGIELRSGCLRSGRRKRLCPIPAWIGLGAEDTGHKPVQVVLAYLP